MKIGFEGSRSRQSFCWGNHCGVPWKIGVQGSCGEGNPSHMARLSRVVLGHHVTILVAVSARNFFCVGQLTKAPVRVHRSSRKGGALCVLAGELVHHLQIERHVTKISPRCSTGMDHARTRKSRAVYEFFKGCPAGLP